MSGVRSCCGKLSEAPGGLEIVYNPPARSCWSACKQIFPTVIPARCEQRSAVIARGLSTKMPPTSLKEVIFISWLLERCSGDYTSHLWGSRAPKNTTTLFSIPNSPPNFSGISGPVHVEDSLAAGGSQSTAIAVVSSLVRASKGEAHNFEVSTYYYGYCSPLSHNRTTT